MREGRTGVGVDGRYRFIPMGRQGPALLSPNFVGAPETSVAFHGPFGP